jgi:hypothetical protein
MGSGLVQSRRNWPGKPIAQKIPKDSQEETETSLQITAFLRCLGATALIHALDATL